MRQDKGTGPALPLLPPLGCSQGLTKTMILEETHFRSESQATQLSELSYDSGLQQPAHTSTSHQILSRSVPVLKEQVRQVKPSPPFSQVV